MAGRAVEPLPVRHEPRLVRPDPARDARPHPDRPRILPAGERRPARAGRQQHLLLRPARRPAEPALHQGADRRLRPVRPGQRRPLRRARLALLHPRGLRRLLPRLRRQLADVPRLDRHDLRAGVGAGAVVHPRRRHRDDLPRRRDAPLQRGDHHRDHRGPQPRAPGARLPRVPAQRRGRGTEGRGARVRAGARARSVPGRAAGPQPGDPGHRGASRRRGGDRRRPHDPRRRLSRRQRAALGPADPQPARPADRAVGRVHRPPGGAPPAPAARPDSTTSPPGACRWSTTSRS